MKTIDVLIALPLLYGAYSGYKKGLLSGFVTLIALVVGLVAGFKCMEQGISWLSGFIDVEATLIPFFAFVLIFVVVVISISLLGKALKKSLEKTVLGTFDDVGGALLGMFKWAVGISLLLWLIHISKASLPVTWTEGALIYPFFVANGPKLIDMVGAITPYTKDLIESIKELL